MVSERIEKALNEQINAEFFSAYVYLAMAAHFAARALPGFAHWMRLQSREEEKHGLRFMDHLLDRGGRVVLQSIGEPPSGFDSAIAAFEQALDQERAISSQIHALHDLALEEGDHAVRPLLLEFIAEQVEEEKAVAQIVDQLRMVGEQRGALLFVDHRLGKRSLGTT